MTTAIAKIPSLQELVEQSEQGLKENALMVIVNQEPPKQWVMNHPTAKVKKNGVTIPVPYLPVSRVEYLLTRIYSKWWLEIKAVQCIANSCVVTVRLYVINPITGATEWMDGVGASPIQTDAGMGAMDWNHAKAHGVMISVPAAETYAFKDAAEKFGKLFGKDLARDASIDYSELLKKDDTVTEEDLRQLFKLKKDSMSADEIRNAERILDGKEVKSYRTLHKQLAKK